MTLYNFVGKAFFIFLICKEYAQKQKKYVNHLLSESPKFCSKHVCMSIRWSESNDLLEEISKDSPKLIEENNFVTEKLGKLCVFCKSENS